jgi:outer membrane protein OmpA-like peptidoglycan-associated protein
MKKTISLVIALFTLVSYQSADAQNVTYEYPGFNIGIYGGANFNMHSPDFQSGVNFIDLNTGLPTVETFNVDQNELALGLNAGVIINYPFNEYLTLSGRLGYNDIGGIIFGESIDGDEFINNGYTSSNVRREFDASLGYFEISPMLQLYNLLPVDNLYFLVGPEIGIPVLNEFADNSSITVDGNAGTFISNFDDYDGVVDNNYEFTDPELRFALGIGVGYNIEISDNIFLTPELSYRLAFTEIASDEVTVAGETFSPFDSWNANQLRLSVALTFGFEDDEEIVVAPDSEMEVGFNGVNYMDNGVKKPVKNIKVEEVQYAELFPLVPHVYFEQNAATIDDNTQVMHAKSQTGEFVPENLPSDILTVNKSTLDIIGSRMKKYPNSEITIVGTNDGKEPGGKSLSQKRADYAKAYLVSNYGVPAGKVNTDAQNLPDSPSTSRVEEGMAENRRAEFYTKNPNILEPIIIEDESTVVATPALVMFEPYANSTDPISSWELTVSQSGKTLKKINGLGDLGDISWSIQPNQIQQTNTPVDYNLMVENNKGMKKMASGSIPVEYLSYQLKQSEEKAGKTISKYSLVVFEFDSPNVSDYDKKIIEKYVLPAIKFNSTVQIYGYTDNIGSADYNKKLAGQRAQSVKDFISSKKASAEYEVYSVGEEANIVNNDLQVGRQLSRTVQIYVITPNE